MFKTEPLKTWTVAKAPAWVWGGVDAFGGNVTLRLGEDQLERNAEIGEDVPQDCFIGCV